ncbi:hypothetical protein OQA88_8754 [Cercophora sp. LCS_1]
MTFEFGATRTRPSFYNDSWFGASPLASSKMVSLQFRHGEPFQVHEDLLFHEWKMRALIPTATKNHEVFRQFISRISRSAGHILVQFLYTNRYSPLGWEGPTDDDVVKAASLHTAIEVYAAARFFRLSWLERLAKNEITKLANDVDLFTTIDIVKETYPDVSGNDTWFPTFIKSTMKAALEKPRVPATAATSLDKLLLWGAMEVFRDKLDALTAMTTSAAEHHVSDATPAPCVGEEVEKVEADPPETVEEAVLEFEPPAKSLSPEVEPASFPVEEPSVQRDPLPEPEPEEDAWAIPVTTKKSKKDKKPKKASKKAKAAEEAAELISETLTPSDEPVAFADKEPLLKEELPPLSEPEAEVAEDFFITTTSKKEKKGKKKLLGKKKTLAPVEVPADSPIMEGWVGAESDSL